MPVHDLSDPEVARGRCLIESQALVTAARRRHIPALYVRVTGREYGRREHWAMFVPDDLDDPVDGEVTDLTARQFSLTAASPWVGRLDDWLDDVCEWLVDGLDVEIHDEFTSGPPVAAWMWIREDVEPGPMWRSA